MGEIWVLVDKAQNAVRNVTAEFLVRHQGERKNGATGLRRLCRRYCSELLKQIWENTGAEKFYKIENPALKDFNPEDLYAAALSEVIKKHNPDVVLGGNTLQNQDFLPRVASRTAAGLCLDAMNIDIGSSSALQVKRYKYIGKSIATISFHDVKPMIATIKLNALEATEVLEALKLCLKVLIYLQMKIIK